MATTKEEIIQGLYDTIEKKRTEIAKAEKPKWETNCLFRYSKEQSASTNLQVCSNVDDLVDMLSFIMNKEAFHNEAMEALNVSSKFRWLGFTLTEWKSDIQTRVSKLEIVSKKKELEELESRLNKLEITKEMREQMELDAIKKLLEKQ